MQQQIRNGRNSCSEALCKQYNSDDFRIAWRRFPVNQEIIIPKFYGGKAYRDDEDRDSSNLFFLSHFCLSGNAKIKSYSPDCSILQSENSLFMQDRKTVEIRIQKCPQKEYSLFEYSFSEQFFLENFLEDSEILRTLIKKYEKYSLAWAGRNLTTSPAMNCLINDMMNSPFKGKMHKMFLESKMTNLFLLQIKEFDLPVTLRKISSYDEERIQYVKKYIDKRISDDIDILQLSRLAGINQTKLKKEFKQLFGVPVYSYIIEQRMILAHHLLSMRDLSVSEIAEKAGYCHISHFTNAFKKRYGFPPSLLMR